MKFILISGSPCLFLLVFSSSTVFDIDSIFGAMYFSVIFSTVSSIVGYCILIPEYPSFSSVSVMDFKVFAFPYIP